MVWQNRFIFYISFEFSYEVDSTVWISLGENLLFFFFILLGNQNNARSLVFISLNSHLIFSATPLQLRARCPLS